ncbi:MAG: biotin--[acetyl-CoA-carboxylase] ligase [Deltaproteobacteria bacterium]|nr:biotin--[acetyl-CoA-carboxylase] ligase [Deltaproteobacteria bacterium]
MRQVLSHKNWKILHTTETDSTQDLLRNWISQQSNPDKTLVVSLNQNTGRGRHKRQWESPAGNLSFSFALTLAPNDLKDAAQWNLLFGLALKQSLQSLLQKEFQLKWPNDVLYQNKKVAGLLSEYLPEQNTLLVGVGLNLNSSPEDFSPALQESITTVRHIAERGFCPFMVTARFLNHLSPLLSAPVSPEQLSQEFCWQNQEVILSDDIGPCFSGQFLGINDQGSLILNQNGHISYHQAGDLNLRKS